MTKEVTVLEHMMVLNLDVNIWSASKKLSPEDFGGVKLPPEELASLGSKKICNPKDMRIFNTLKSRAVCMLNRIGVRFLNGWAVPLDKVKQVADELEVIHDEFLEAKRIFLSGYDQRVNAWLNQHTEWKEIIANSVVSAEYVSSRLGFKYQLFQLVAPGGTDVGGGLKEEVNNLGNTLYAEIATAAEDTWKKSYLGKDQVSQKALSPVRSIYEKINGLSFVEPSAAPIANLLRVALTEMPPKGYITGVDLVVLQGVLALLRDPEALLEHGRSMIDGASPEKVLKGLVQPDNHNQESGSLDGIPSQPQHAIESLGLW